jgi:hypothetical protein
MINGLIRVGNWQSDMKDKGRVKLSGSGMTNITRSRMEKDFTFIVGEHRHSCPWFIAGFISPKVGRLHTANVTVNELEIETKDLWNESEKIISLGLGLTVSVPRENRRFFLSIVRELCKWELYFLIHDLFEDNVIISDFCQKIQASKQIESFSKQAISILASHFFELDSSFIENLPIFT